MLCDQIYGKRSTDVFNIFTPKRDDYLLFNDNFWQILEADATETEKIGFEMH